MSVEEDFETVRATILIEVEEVARARAAISALERVEAESDRLKKALERVEDTWRSWAQDYKDQRDELREALREIATLTWNPAIGLPATSDSDLHNIARAVLEEDK